MSEKKKKLIIAAYCRVSTDSEDQVTSFRNQQSFMEREIKERGHELYRIYADRGLTGTQIYNRPEFIEMLEDAGLDKVKFLNESNRNESIQRAKTPNRNKPKKQPIIR